MARFVIADITDLKSEPQELSGVIPFLPSVPIQPIMQSSAEEYVLFENFERYNWVLKPHRYNDIGDLTKFLEEKVIAPAEEKAKELQKKCL